MKKRSLCILVLVGWGSLASFLFVFRDTRALRAEVLQLVSAPEQEVKKNKRVQTILILPGPHKTGTTTVQARLSKHFRDGHVAFSNWSWPAPTKAIWEKYASNYTDQAELYKETDWTTAKGHAALAFRLHGKQGYMPEINDQFLLDIYRETLQNDWEAGKNIVIASEELDTLAVEVPKGERQEEWLNNSISEHKASKVPSFWSKLLSLLQATSAPLIRDEPPTIQEVLWDNIYNFLPSHPDIDRRIVVGIFHRESRSDHLVSLWNEVTQDDNTTTLAEFIYTAEGHKTLLKHNNVLNSFKLAQVMYESIQVDEIYMLNTAGLERANKDVVVSSLDLIVGCQMMKVPCHQTSRGQWYLQGDRKPSRRAEKPPKSNSRVDTSTRGLNETTIATMGTMMRNYDCQFQSYLPNADNEKMHYLHFDKPPFADCPNQPRKGKCGSKVEPAFLPVAEQMRRLACEASIDCKVN